MEDLNCERATATNTLAQVLRLELKEWEQSFAATHQGRKAGREDIKQRPEIGQSSQFATFRNHLLTQPSTQVQTVQ